jgi:hypothetical protein
MNEKWTRMMKIPLLDRTRAAAEALTQPWNETERASIGAEARRA